MLRAIDAAAEKVNAPGTGVHTLRHSAAVTLMENKVHIKGQTQRRPAAEVVQVARLGVDSALDRAAERR
jgi:integrase